MSILSTDLVYGSDPTHLVQYMHQCAIAGQIPRPFLSDGAKFMPVHHGDLTQAVATSLSSKLTGQFAVRGNEEVSSLQLLNLVEKSCGRDAGATKGRFQIPVLPLARIFEEYLIGMATDTNMAEMITYFEEESEAVPVTGSDFWAATNTSASQSLSKFFETHRVAEDSESLLLPTFGGYKFNYTD